MKKNKETLAALLRLSAAAWRAYDEHGEHDTALYAAAMSLDSMARSYGKEFYRDNLWGMALAADQLLEVVWTK